MKINTEWIVITLGSLMIAIWLILGPNLIKSGNNNIVVGFIFLGIISLFAGVLWSEKKKQANKTARLYLAVIAIVAICASAISAQIPSTSLLLWGGIGMAGIIAGWIALFEMC